MLEYFIWPSLLWYWIFSALVYQQLSDRMLTNAAVYQKTVLVLLRAAAGLCALAYLLMYGMKVAWWMPIAMFLLIPILAVPALMLKGLVGKETMIFVACIGIPVSGIFMFTTLRTTT